MELIYHNLNNPTDISPFDQAIINMVKGQDIRIVSPYLSLSYLKRIIGISNSWCLISDIAEWIISHPKAKDRHEIQEFIVTYSDRIHHIKGIHAKVIVSKSNAFIGSANFTMSGMTRRNEMSILLSEDSKVKELNNWFETLWSASQSVQIKELEKYLEGVQTTFSEPTPQPKQQLSLSSHAPSVRSKLQHLPTKIIAQSKNSVAHNRLITYLRFAPNRNWMNCYFNLAEELIQFTGLQKNDPRLVMSIPKDRCLPITINRRYVLSAFRRGKPCVGFIVQGRLDVVDNYGDKSMYDWSFKPFGSELKDNTPTPHFFFREDAYKILKDSAVRESWKDAVLFEVTHGNFSPYHKYHEPIMYELAIDHDYRDKMLDEAFSSKI